MESLRTVLLFLAVLCSIPLRNAATQNISLGSQNVSRATMAPQLTQLNGVIEKWENFDRNLKQLASEGIKMLLPIVLQRYEKMGSTVSPACMGNVLRLLAGLKESKVWAFSILDASGKAVDGLLAGSLASLGEYDQCLNTEAVNERRGRNYGNIIFRGKYCALDIKPPLPPKKPYYKIDEVIDDLKNFSTKGTVAAEAAKSAHFFYFLALRIGICVPSGCSEQDISTIAQSVMMQRSGWSATVNRCEIKEDPIITPVMMVVLALFGLLAFLLVIGTTVDLIYYFKKQKMKVCGTGLKVLTSFSFVSNFRRLVTIRSTNEPLGCLNGVRFLSITWIILGHTYITVNFQLFRGLRIVATYQRDFAFQAVVNATIAVDTFFFMGGLLVCYVTIKMVKERKKPFDLTLYIFHRIWRLWPAYAVVIFLMAFAPIAGTGPVWHDIVDRDINNCYSNWWTNLVFLNNYLHAENICLTHSWYVAADIQLYLFSLIILLPLIRWPKVGISLAVLSAIISMIVTSWITYSKGLPPTMLFIHPDAEQRIEYLANVYFKPYPHAGPYFIGILAGYLLSTKPNIRFPRVGLIFGWCAAAVCNLSVLYGVWDWNKGRDPTFWETVFYSGSHRTAWSLGVAWVVICCSIGKGGIVNYILTWKAWVPLGRLTYAAYLIHPLVQLKVVGTLRMKLQPFHDFAVWMYFGHLMVTYGMAFVLSMMIEAPCLALEKVFLKKELLADSPKNKTPTDALDGTAPEIHPGKKRVVNAEENLSSETQNYYEVCKL